MRIKQPVIKYNESEFLPTDASHTTPGIHANVDKVHAFIMLHGASKWNDLRAQFARQRTPMDLPVDQASIATMSDEEYEKKRQRILDSQKTAPKDKDISATVEAPDLRSLGLQGQALYKETFGAKRYFEAMGVNVSLDTESYRQVTGSTNRQYTRTSTANSAPAATSDNGWTQE